MMKQVHYLSSDKQRSRYQTEEGPCQKRESQGRLLCSRPGKQVYVGHPNAPVGNRLGYGIAYGAMLSRFGVKHVTSPSFIMS